MAYGTLNAGAITPGSGATLTLSENISLGTVTAGNLTNSALTFPTGHVLKVTTLTSLTGDVTLANSVTSTNWWPSGGTYTPHGGSGNNTTIHCCLNIRGVIASNDLASTRVDQKITITGSDITDVNYTSSDGEAHGIFQRSNEGQVMDVNTSIWLKPVTLDGTGKGALTFGFFWAGYGTGGSGGWDTNSSWKIIADGSAQETHLKIFEVQ